VRAWRFQRGSRSGVLERRIFMSAQMRAVISQLLPVQVFTIYWAVLPELC